MRVTIIGATDIFADGVAGWALEAGHDLTIVGFHRAQSEAYVRRLGSGAALGPREPIHDEVIFLALPYECLQPVLRSYGDHLNGKLMVDVITPLDPRSSEPIRSHAGSAAEEIQEFRPGIRVVKVFNPRLAGPIVSGREIAEAGRELLLAADDEAAKCQMSVLFCQGGLRPLDIGPLRRARELEALGYLHFALRVRRTQTGSLGTVHDFRLPLNA